MHEFHLITAVGCADLTLASDVWIKREGDEATVGCHSSQQTWRLNCIGNHWTGVIGNCTAGKGSASLMYTFRNGAGIPDTSVATVEQPSPVLQ